MQSLCQGGAKKKQSESIHAKDKAKKSRNDVSFISKMEKEMVTHPLYNLGREMVADPFLSLTTNAINTSLFVYLSIQSNLVHVKEDEFKTGCSLLPSVSARATRRSYICELGRFVLLMSLFDYSVLTY